MSVDRPLTNARGHIAWILALVVSTALIVWLEQGERGFCGGAPVSETTAGELP